MRAVCLLLACTLLVAGLFVPRAHAGVVPRQVEYGTVEVVGFQDTRQGLEAVVWGSGALVESGGLIVTAFHVVGDPETGRPLNAEGIAGVSLVERPGEGAVPAYLAQVVTYSVSLDLALLEVAMTLDGGRLPRYLFFPTLPQPGLRDQAPAPGDALTAYGFGAGYAEPPIDVGGTLQRYGAVTGFGGRPMVVTTTATYPSGLTGGPVLDGNGRLAGVALGMTGRGADALGVVRSWEEVRDWASGQISVTQTITPVVVAGQIVDHNTQRGIPGAQFFVLRPGVVAEDFLANPSDADVAARAQADRDGRFVTAPAVDVGVGYNMVVYAEDYRLTYTTRPVVLDQSSCAGGTQCDLGVIELDRIQ